ncbi:flagellar biosynthesis anti-sigma factor FlgM [Vibrio sp. 10N.286.49.B3]|uniref:flagellar biosynthesis anti-sigma factor FlgM n=1 Tax=Vibrio sp. 10N.286.49.B3 TaxID=1880855 RepID=UPI000C829879|nr:flagellar biosynthesis anti-sigma factor FlgM [Vibrio sp. 10N.286.49.B3]PMH41001.1 flagellar biosynthesis anti-sigma factor FlgM [Vibrio sp. 10N.286.49.B3]
MANIDQLRSAQAQAYATNNRTQGRNQAAETTTSQNAAKPAANTQDAVSISSQSKAMGQLQQNMANEPSFDSAKVAAIKEAIANGSYTVDAEKLAGNIMRFEQELSGL